MAIKINLTEQNNELFSDFGGPIVCGNSNYILDVDFSEEWLNLKNKIAVFSVECKNRLVDFEENTCKVPALPNAGFVNIYFLGITETGKTLATTSARIELAPTADGSSAETFDNTKSEVAEILTAFKNLETSDMQIGGTKNFTGSLQSKGNPVATLTQISNPNLLINGDFRINQRGKTTYTEAGKYTVDRWKLVSGSVEVSRNGIILNGTIVQKLEHAPDGETTASADTSGGNVSATYANGTFTLSTTTPTLIKWVKLEIGTTATPFSPRSYAEELAMCQRYYQVVKKQSGNTNLNLALVRNETNVRIFVNLVQSLRISPTIKNSNCTLFNILNDSLVSIVDDSLTVICISANQCVLNHINNNLTRGNIYFVSDVNGLAKIELDAEIY